MGEPSVGTRREDAAPVSRGSVATLRPVVRQRKSRDSSRARRHRLRMLYFMGASIWGCICGLAALLAGLELSGRPLQIDGTLVLLLVVALLGASFGGALTCMAYREVVGRGTR